MSRELLSFTVTLPKNEVNADDGNAIFKLTEFTFMLAAVNKIFTLNIVRNFLFARHHSNTEVENKKTMLSKVTVWYSTYTAWDLDLTEKS
ncbi:CLUMA_CG008778, isoform A [Clunio marinus]|uniref:CLUMA_CG008778, isoform A n=1 Tax=Clunio marinus TaxID=568069 RepID=A0A1J1I644_9DIPT|nr:CLUMA_CG008778, isoform A [Clunio marinus]